MARDWSKMKSRDQARQAQVEDRRIMNELARDEPQPSKAELRIVAENAIASYRGPITQLPSYVGLRCRSCGHRGVARVPYGKSPRFRCAGCGSSLIAKTV